LQDVVLAVRYTAEQGDVGFTNAVKGLLKPYPAFRYVDIATEFPDDWEEFLGNDSPDLVLRLEPGMFPDMASRQITAIYTRFTAGGAVSMVLNGDPDWTLQDGRLVATNGLTLSSQGSDWTFTLRGSKSELTGLELVLGYTASVR
jgi:hypothetical protein